MPRVVIRALLILLIVYACLGLAASVTVHVLSLFDPESAGAPIFIVLHVGIFPLWLALAPITNKQAMRGAQKDFWKNVSEGCPRWMAYGLQALFGYAVLNFALGMVSVVLGMQREDDFPARMFSGHWMAFYAAGLVAALGAYLRDDDPPVPSERHCPNGHPVPQEVSICAICRAQIEREDA